MPANNDRMAGEIRRLRISWDEALRRVRAQGPRTDGSPLYVYSDTSGFVTSGATLPTAFTFVTDTTHREQGEAMPAFTATQPPDGCTTWNYVSGYPVPDAALPAGFLEYARSGNHAHGDCACVDCVRAYLITVPSMTVETFDAAIEAYSDAVEDFTYSLEERVPRTTISEMITRHGRFAQRRLDALASWYAQQGTSLAARQNQGVIAEARSRWLSSRGRGEEQAVPEGMRDLVREPLRFMLRKSGRVWSAEVECNGLHYGDVAGQLGLSTGNYSTRPDRPVIIATGDATVDAEIKVSCRRDGSRPLSVEAVAVYDAMRGWGQFCAENAGHHVHVDATRLGDLGWDIARDVTTAAAQLGWVTAQALVPLSSSGYRGHRYAGAREGRSSWALEPGMDDYVMQGRYNLHGERLGHAARRNDGRNATIEYRLPNGTLWPIRAHAHAAIALGLLDWAERAVLDGDPEASAELVRVRDRLGHVQQFNQVNAAEFLSRALHLHDDSLRAVAVAAATGPATDGHTRVWRDLAGLTARQLQI